MAGKRSTEGGGNPSLHIGSGVIGGSTDGATEADLQRGYVDCSEHTGYGPQDSTLAGSYEPFNPEPKQGFLDRPTGWER